MVMHDFLFIIGQGAGNPGMEFLGCASTANHLRTLENPNLDMKIMYFKWPRIDMNHTNIFLKKNNLKYFYDIIYQLI